MMATNPKFADYHNFPQRRPKDDHARVELIRQSKFPWPMLALIAGAALLIAIIAVLPRGPHVTKPPAAAAVPQQPTAEQIQLSAIKVVPSPVGGALYLDAMLHNTGNSAVTGVQVQGQFLGKKGQPLQTETGTMQGMTATGAGTEELTQALIKPNETRPVRIYFASVPKAWNHEAPQLTVSTVTGTTP
jgi:hypothetical protein